MVDAIFLQSHPKEIMNGRFFNFVENFKFIFDFSVPLFIFFTNEVRKVLGNNPPVVGENVHFVYLEDPFVNSASVFFHSMINYAVCKYRRILLLETDCIVEAGFLQSINLEVSNYENFLMFGSKYYGNGFLGRRPSTWTSEHINGVAVYDRTEENLKFINDCFSIQGLFSKKLNYDVAICKHFVDKKINFYDKLIDAESILNICKPVDVNLDYRTIKPGAKIIHTKSIL